MKITSKTLVVARWELLATITRRAYIFAVVAMPIVYGGMAAVGGFAGRVTAATSNRQPIAVVDRAGVMDVEFAAAQEAAAAQAAADDGGPGNIAPARTPLVRYDDLDRAIDELRARRVVSVILIDRDYLESGRISEYSHDSGFFSQQTARQRQQRVGAALRASLMKPLTAMGSRTLARAYTPVGDVTRLVMNNQGQVAETEDSGLGAFGVFYILLLSIFMSAGFLQQATIDDRQNRMLEILLSSVDADELLIGKLMGLGGAGLLQVSIYLLLVIVPGATMLALFKVSLASVALSMVYFVIAYLLFACLMTGTGMLGRTPQESAQFAMLWTFAAASPVFFVRAIATQPNGLVARALSFFPLTSPTTMMLRLTSGDVPTTDIVVSIVIGFGTIYAVLRAASKIFRAASLMYGKRPTVPELLRWLRTA